MRRHQRYENGCLVCLVKKVGDTMAVKIPNIGTDRASIGPPVQEETEHHPGTLMQNGQSISQDP